jgi:actin-related protein 2
MSESNLPPIIIIDNGSGYLKAGFSNEKIPSVTIPALIGRQLLRYGEKIDTSLLPENVKYKEIMIGDEVTPFRSLLELTHPIEEGIIKNEDDLEKLWSYVINTKLKITDPSNYKVIITEAPLNPFDNKIKICETLFEKIGVGAVNIEPQAKLSLFCHGIDTGTVLDSGDGVTHCIPIAKGVILKHSIERLNIAGRHITEYLIRLLQKKGYAFNSTADFEFIREIKEKLCFVSNDINSDREIDRNTTFFNSFYLLPDGSRIRISNEKFEAPEILFDPYLCGKDVDGIQYVVHKSIINSPMDTRAGLFGNIILSGATTLFPGFVTRLENEIKTIYKEKNLKEAKEKNIKISINVLDHPNRKYSVFIGAGIVGNYYNTPESDDYWITRDEWLECEEGTERNRENLIKEKCQNYFKDSYKKE